MFSSKIFLFCVFYFSAIRLSIQEIILYGINDCENPVEGKGTLSQNFETSPKRLTAKFHLPEDINDESMFLMRVLKNVEGVWVQQNEATSNLCESLDDFLQGAYGKFKSAVKPALTEECLMEAGDYELEDFQLDQNDVDVPLGMEGEFKVEFTPHTSSEDPFFCFQIHVSVVI